MRVAFGLVSLLALVAAFLLSTQMRWSLLLLVVAALVWSTHTVAPSVTVRVVAVSAWRAPRVSPATGATLAIVTAVEAVAVTLSASVTWTLRVRVPLSGGRKLALRFRARTAPAVDSPTFPGVACFF